MMRSREEIKEYAKQAFFAQRKPATLAMFLVFLPMIVPMVLYFLMILLPILVSGFGGSISVVGVFSAIGFFLIWLVVMGVSWFLFPVLNTNLNGFFVKVFYGQQVVSSEPYTDLKINFGRKLGGFYWMYLWLYLWSLLATPLIIVIVIVWVTMLSSTTSLAVGVMVAIVMPFVTMSVVFIPLIIKFLAYCMSPFILSTHPNVTAINALNLSKRMTRGYRGKIFVMGLSFIGWHILNGLTLGILGIFFVGPYVYTTMAGYFVELRHTAITNGTIHPGEFEGMIPVSQAYYGEYSQQPPQPYNGYPPMR